MMATHEATTRSSHIEAEGWTSIISQCTHSVCIRCVKLQVIKAHKQLSETTSDVILAQQPAVQIRDEPRDELPLWIVTIERQHDRQLGDLVSVGSNVQLVQQRLRTPIITHNQQVAKQGITHSQGVVNRPIF